MQASVYVRVMQKVSEKGEGYVAKELDRLGKISSVSLAAEKKAELEEKMKILSVFNEALKEEL